MPRPFSTARSASKASLLLVVLGSLLLPACGDDPAGPELSADNLRNLVIASDELTMLEAIVEELGLASLLATNDLTFFAPTDEAFNSLGDETVNTLELSRNRDVLEKLIRRHLVPGLFRVADLSDGQLLEPLDGPPLEVRIDGEEVTVGGALVTEPDLRTSNGVLHQVDELVRDHLTLAERLRITPIVRTFADAVEDVGLQDLVNSEEPYTLLIPINSAFQDLGSDVLQSLLSGSNRDILEHVLRHHIAPGRVPVDALEDGGTLTLLDGSRLPVRVENGSTYLGEARVIIPGVETSNGLIHLLDTAALDYLDLGEHLRVAPDLSKTQQILSGAGLNGVLDGDAPFTIFAPTDAALSPLGNQFVSALNERPALLQKTARHYVVPGRVEPADLMQDGTLTTLGGTSLPVQVQTSGGGTNVFLGGRGLVAFPPIEAANGLIYSISPFLFPPDLNLEERAVYAALYEFLDVMEIAGLTSLLRDPGPYTIFAPVGEALAEANIPASQRQRTLRYHIVEGRYGFDEFEANPVLTLPTLAGPTDNLTVYNLGMGGLWVVGASDSLRVARVDLDATNGVLHSIEGVLSPPNP
jgi:uncharacterized surface protein with fasciclin (FAS1) repeats